MSAVARLSGTLDVPPRTGQAPSARAGVREAEVVLDLSRLLSRMLHPTPTGVDRVELAYARHLIRAIPHRLRFSAVHPSGIYGRLDHAAVLRFLDRTEARWDDAVHGRWRHRAEALFSSMALQPHILPPPRPQGPRIYLQASPHHLHKRARVAAILKREQAKMICLLHDLIPIEYPEYGRASGAALHRARIDTMAEMCTAIVANSDATRLSFEENARGGGPMPLVRVIHLGTHDMPAGPDCIAGSDPYFVCIGTIEPRKNHLLLLNIWRRMVEVRGADRTPRLVLIGRRGWENENVIDMLERCPALRGRVEEHSDLRDRSVAGLLRGSRALLMPSFAEGFGMPVTEALGAGVPVICSDLPALREAGGDVPEFLDPLDGHAWIRAVSDYAVSPSPRRVRQIERMTGWKPPTWEAHVDGLLDLIEEVAA
ncbi:MAG: glycosyl transferase, group 1 [Sphingomonas bacterium]|nr:glycosyltransferase family 1 protein [Sphingomonas bacterium]MDB5688138.1 glycosyl transferase, group 1 [Sphingomonas bacterium]